MLPVEAPGGGVLTVPIDLPGRVVQAAVWKAQVGSVPVLMLDTDIPLNDPADRPITGVLYGAAARCACARRSCSASAACARCAPLGI